MSTCCLRVLAGRRGGLLNQHSDTLYIPIHLVTVAAAEDRELRHFNAEEALLEISVGEEIYIFKILEEYQEFPEA